MEALADRAETDLRQLGGVERGTRNATYGFLLRLAEALETSVGEITTKADQIRASSQ